jgi:membrane-bound acyltransferase YfiQ involved in biofilm formation
MTRKEYFVYSLKGDRAIDPPFFSFAVITFGWLFAFDKAVLCYYNKNRVMEDFALRYKGITAAESEMRWGGGR